MNWLFDHATSPFVMDTLLNMSFKNTSCHLLMLSYLSQWRCKASYGLKHVSLEKKVKPSRLISHSAQRDSNMASAAAEDELKGKTNS